MRRIICAVLGSLLGCASTPLPREIATLPVATIEPRNTAPKCESPGTIRHVVVATWRYTNDACPLFMPAFDEFIQVGCAKALPELAAAVGALHDVMKKKSWYDVSARHQVSAEHEEARLRVASIAWSMMPTRCQNHVPKPTSEGGTNMSIADIDPSWRDCYPDEEYLLTHFDEPDIAGKITLLGYVFGVAVAPYMTSVGEQFLRETLFCNTMTKARGEDELAYRAFGW